MTLEYIKNFIVEHYKVILAIVVLLIIIIVIIVMCSKSGQRDNFNIGVNPYYDNTRYEEINDPSKCPPRKTVENTVQYNGLNPQYNNFVTLQDYLDTYGGAENFKGNDTCDVTARRYCALVYTAHQEYFTDRWSGIGECEIDIKAQCEKLKPEAPKKAIFDN